MAEKKAFGRGRKRGMSFKPSGGRNRRPDRTSLKARANVETIQTTQDEIYDNRQHRSEIVRAENKAHGLPPDTDLDSAKAQRQLTNESTGADGTAQDGSVPSDNQAKAEFAPVELPEEPAGSIKEKVQRSAKKFVYFVVPLLLWPRGGVRVTAPGPKNNSKKIVKSYNRDFSNHCLPSACYEGRSGRNQRCIFC